MRTLQKAPVLTVSHVDFHYIQSKFLKPCDDSLAIMWLNGMRVSFILATNKISHSLKGNINPINLIFSFIVHSVYINSFYNYYDFKLTINY